MSGWFSRNDKRRKILILGPRNAGKTTLMYRLTNQPLPVSMVPTAYDVLEKSGDAKSGLKLTFLEQKQYTPGSDAVVYVVSSSTFEKDVQALKSFVEHIKEGLAAPLLVLVNKKDLENQDKTDKQVNELAEVLFDALGAKQSFNVLSCSAQKDESLDYVLDWLDVKLN